MVGKGNSGKKGYRLIMTNVFFGDKLKKVLPNVFIAQPRRNSGVPLLQVVYESPYVVTPYACKTLYGSTSGLAVDEGRNCLMQHALQCQAEYVFFVDDDVVLPYDGFQKLYHAARSQNILIVGGVVTGKHIDPALPMTSCINTDRHVYIPDLSFTDGSDALVDVNWMTGFACLLVSTKVLRAMIDDDPNMPFCRMVFDENKNVACGEDMWFIQRALSLGFRVVVHRGVQCRHYDLATGRFWGGCAEGKYFLNVDGRAVLG